MSVKEKICQKARQGGKTLVVFMMSVVTLMSLASCAVFQGTDQSAPSDPTSEARFNLGGIFVTATALYAETGTYEVARITDLGFVLVNGKLRYSVWYAVNGQPTMIPLQAGASLITGPCDLTTPPTSVRVTASKTGFVAAVKGNLDDDATCDEWSVNENKEFRHTLDDGVQ